MYIYLCARNIVQKHANYICMGRRARHGHAKSCWQYGTEYANDSLQDYQGLHERLFGGLSATAAAACTSTSTTGSTATTGATSSTAAPSPRVIDEKAEAELVKETIAAVMLLCGTAVGAEGAMLASKGLCRVVHTYLTACEG